MRLKGTCNRCGLCCFGTSADGRAIRCMHLRVSGKPGEPFATRCAIHDARTPMMPIVMVDKLDNQVLGDWVCSCSYGTIFETIEILQKGIGRGCSMELEV